MNAPNASVAPPTATESALAVLVPALAVPPASMVPLQCDRAAGVRPVMPSSVLTPAVGLNTPPLATDVLPIAACGDDSLMSQPQ
jgi:hypothetical protein